MTETPNHPNLNGLVELANRDGIDIRPTLLRVMTDLYVQKPSHTEQEERHFTELALRLIDLVDAKTCAIVANNRAVFDRSREAVMAKIQENDAATAALAVTRSSMLSASASNVPDLDKARARIATR